MKNSAQHRLTNKQFLKVVSGSFAAFLNRGTSRSTEKLKPLHGAIAKDIAERLGSDYEIWAKGYRNDRESKIEGRYINKRVDITIKKDRRAVAGIAVKFVMQNYSQNSNNYFENMLGETANIRCNNCPYFQIFIILDKLPYYKKDKSISKWEKFTAHNIAKYTALSKDDTGIYLHTPNKTLIYVVHIPDAPSAVDNHAKYLDFYRNNPHDLTLSGHTYAEFGSAVILNDYETFMDKIYHTVKAL